VTANRIKVFKILTVDPEREQWDLTVSQLETVRIKRGGFELYEFENLTKRAVCCLPGM
jgi:hypothetical protein